MQASRTWLVVQLRALTACAIGSTLLAPLAFADEAGDYYGDGRVVASADDSVVPPPVPEVAPPMTEPMMMGEPVAPSPPSKSDAAAAKKLQAAVAGAYKPLYYDNNFDYLCNPKYDDHHLGEGLKRICIHDGSMILDLGGEYRARYHHEHNFRGIGLTGNSDDFLLHRTRLYSNLQIGERVRLYGEYIDAESNYENDPPRSIEVNRSDVLNLFGDLVLFDNDCHGKLTGRVGRQELLYGDQRLISPLDWANTRRTFDGGKLMWAYEDWKVDGFWTRPVIVDPKNLDENDAAQQFYGAYSTYGGIKDHALDLYYIGYQSDRVLFPGTQTFNYHTTGSRWAATWDCGYLSLVEGAYQFGDYGAADDHSAGFATLGVGKKWADHCWKPEVWAYYDWVSGDDTIGNGFNQLFPLGHKYMGFMDLFARSNLEDVNFTLAVQPHEKLKALLWYHIFMLENGNDVPYNVNGRLFVTTPGGDRSLGQEIDLLFTYTINPRSDIVFGYSHFFAGDWYRTNPAAPFAGDADFFYTQFSVRF